jgi:YbbR domain-containing protein
VSEKFKIGIAALTSVLFITGVWFSFSRGLETLVTLEVPVEYMNRDPETEILDTSVNAVRLELSGSGTLIKSIRPEQVRVRLDLSKAVVGRNTLTITQENITLPPGVFFKKVEPPSLEVTLDVPIKKELPIQVDWVGKLPDHLILAATIYTQKVSLDNIQGSGTITVNLALNPASLRTARGSKDRITVEFVVKERLQ